ncbi:coiled-coil domain-containing protein 97 [Tiliqua scincoides]|uniref:coiled-coil domain-containing protein 97 n=1 Tax=Tiliqua scincoides TaxID=71010 RepID=UPI00346202E4
MEAGGGHPLEPLSPSGGPALAGVDSLRNVEQGNPDSLPSADMLESGPLDKAEAAKTLPSAEEMVEIPAARDCPPESSRVLNVSLQVSQGDEQKLDDQGSCGLKATNCTSQHQPLWGEEMSKIPESPSCHRDGNRSFGGSHQREQSQDPGLHFLAEKPGNISSSSLPSYWGEIETEMVASGNVIRTTNMFHQYSGKERTTTLKDSTPNGEESFNAKQSDKDSGKPEDIDPALLAMFHAVANSHLPVKSQQKDEPDFTPAEKLAILRDLYRAKPLVFLERFRMALREEHLPCFRHLSGSYEADFYCAEVRRASLGKTRHTRVRNKRYAALQQLIRGGEYFSDEQMRSRDPLLYEQYIGQYLSDEELQALGSLKLEASCPLSGVLLDSYQEQVIQRRLQIQQEQEEACEEEEEEEEDDIADDGVEATALDPDMEELALDEEEKALLREEFTSRMYQQFLDGKDRDFNYSEVDENPDFDNLDIVSRDEEERYFDGEDPEDVDAMDAE